MHSFFPDANETVLFMINQIEDLLSKYQKKSLEELEYITGIEILIASVMDLPLEILKKEHIDLIDHIRALKKVKFNDICLADRLISIKESLYSLHKRA